MGTRLGALTAATPKPLLDLRRPAVPGLAAAGVPAVRRRGVPAADRASFRGGGGCVAGDRRGAAAGRRGSAILPGTGSGRHRRGAVPCARPAGGAVPAVQRRFPARLQFARGAGRCRARSRRGGGPDRCCAGWRMRRATAWWRPTATASPPSASAAPARQRRNRHGRHHQRRHLPVRPSVLDDIQRPSARWRPR